MTGSVNLLELVAADYDLPTGFDSWALKSVGFDGRTKHGFQWPEPGQVARVDGMDKENESSCPIREGDGLCVALDWAGMASGGYRALCLLLVAYRAAEARGSSLGKLRVPSVMVVARVDGEALVREKGRYADLQGANLRGADLQGANLQGADLRYADLQGANLLDADLQFADLRGANLQYTDLRGASLRGANLQYTDLRGASLRYADLQGANLQDADLRGAIR